MDRVDVADAGRDFAGLVNRVCSKGIGVELQQGNAVVAYLTPAAPRPQLRVRDLPAFLQSLPKLGDDADAFLADVRAIRRRRTQGSQS
jgi:antitoxin (DNA-binding transcriptional repressor) of toxin-antitoxin stability system